MEEGSLEGGDLDGERLDVPAACREVGEEGEALALGVGGLEAAFGLGPGDVATPGVPEGQGEAEGASPGLAIELVLPGKKEKPRSDAASAGAREERRGAGGLGAGAGSAPGFARGRRGARRR